MLDLGRQSGACNFGAADYATDQSLRASARDRLRRHVRRDHDEPGGRVGAAAAALKPRIHLLLPWPARLLSPAAADLVLGRKASQLGLGQLSAHGAPFVIRQRPFDACGDRTACPSWTWAAGFGKQPLRLFPRPPTVGREDSQMRIMNWLRRRFARPSEEGWAKGSIETIKADLSWTTTRSPSKAPDRSDPRPGG